MLARQTLQTMQLLGLRGMAAAYRAQLADPEAQALPFDDRLGILVDREGAERQNHQLARRLREARLRLSSACLEDIDYGPARGLDRSLRRTLAEGQCWHRHGPTPPRRWVGGGGNGARSEG